VAELAAAPWPGNVRELRNHLEQCVVFGERRSPRSPRSPHPSSVVDAALPYELSRRQALAAFERAYVTALLESWRGAARRRCRPPARDSWAGSTSA
jgi:DNA-binding NtrC family response regulator